jgi:endonuclease/exonuclease/phosphatase family metal-dependent hydrolase
MLLVMTFNLRFDNPRDGDHAWPHRREAAAGMIREHAPHLIGTQEGLAPQLDELLALLPGYAAFGSGRRGPRQDEHCRIFYRTDTLRLLDHGDFWLSEIPDLVGSITESWGNTLPRMATWGVFEALKARRRLTFLNTHLDHGSPTARERAAGQLVRFLRRPEVTPPIILAGDLNAEPGSLPLQLLTGERPVDDSRSPLRDASLLAGGGAANEPTYHNFTGRGQERIDYLLVEPTLRAIRYEVLNAPVDGRWVSDHFPVIAALEWPPLTPPAG